MTTNTNTREPTRDASPHPIRRWIGWDEFQTLDGNTDAIRADVARVIFGSGYDKPTKRAYAFLRRHGLAGVTAWSQR